MSCLNLTRCFGGNRSNSDQPENGSGAAVNPLTAADSMQRSKPYQDLSYEVAPGGGVAGASVLHECQLVEELPAEREFPPKGKEGDGSSLLDRLRRLCSREKTPEELEIEMLRKEKKEILKALKTYGLNDKRVTLANMKELRAAVEQSLELERRKMQEPIEMQEMHSASKVGSAPVLETNVDDVLPPVKDASFVDYPLTDPVLPEKVGDGMSWKRASPIALPNID